MNIRRAIDIAREIADQPNVLVDRSVLLSRANDATTYQLAKAFMIPQTFIAHFASDWNDKNTYAGLSFAINSRIDEERSHA